MHIVPCTRNRCHLVFLQVTALVGLKKKEETNLLEEADKYWNEIITQNYVFDRMEKEVRDWDCAKMRFP